MSTVLVPYEKYKDSGVEWLGQIPERWHVQALKHVAALELSNIDKHSVDGERVVFLCNYLDVYNNDQILAGLDFMSATASDEQISRLTLKVGDVIITKDSEDPRDIAIPSYVKEVRENLVCGYHLGLIRPRNRDFGRLLRYTFTSRYGKSYFEVEATGMTRYALGKYSIENFMVPIPDEAESVKIATYLDKQTSRIDALVKEQEELILLLKEKRQALISHAVTKGLDPNANMKPSGVEWLGDIPEGWNVLRIATLFSEVNEEGIDGLPILSVSIHDGVSDKELNDEELDRKVSRSEDKAKYKRVKVDDLVYNMMRAWQGGFGAVKLEGMVSPAYVVARPKVTLLTSFVEQILRTPQAIEELRTQSRGITDFRLRLYWDEFKSVKIALPSLQEQNQIVKFCESESLRIDALVAEAEATIILMQEHRSALISAVVTGKVRVPA